MPLELTEEQNILGWHIRLLEILRLSIQLVMWWMMQWPIIILLIWFRDIILEKLYSDGQASKKISKNTLPSLWLHSTILLRIRESRLKLLMRILQVCSQVRLFLISKKMRQQIRLVQCLSWRDENHKKNLTKFIDWTTFLDQVSEMFFYIRRKLSSWWHELSFL